METTPRLMAIDTWDTPLHVVLKQAETYGRADISGAAGCRGHAVAVPNAQSAPTGQFMSRTLSERNI